MASRRTVKFFDVLFQHTAFRSVGVPSAADDCCARGQSAMAGELPPILIETEHKLRQERLKVRFAEIERALLPVDRPLTEAEILFLKTPIGVDSK
jgi:hypothetical protein